MKILQTMVALITALTLAFPASVTAQVPQRTTSGEQYFSQKHRQRLYEESKKSELHAILWTLALPPLGDIYAEEYFWAGITGIFMVFAATFVGFALTTGQDTFLIWGAVTAGVSYTTAGVTSVMGVRSYNHELQRALKVGLANPEDARGISLSFSW